MTPGDDMQRQLLEWRQQWGPPTYFEVRTYVMAAVQEHMKHERSGPYLCLLSPAAYATCAGWLGWRGAHFNFGPVMGAQVVAVRVPQLYLRDAEVYPAPLPEDVS